MARPREPIDLLIAKQKKHLTKEEIEDRRATEVKAPSDNIQTPDYLCEELRLEFTDIAKQLKELDMMSNLDKDALARFVIAKSLYITVSKQILKYPNVLLSGKFEKMIANQDKLFRQCRMAASDLGLTITSRCKLIIPKKEEKRPNKWDKFIKYQDSLTEEP